MAQGAGVPPSILLRTRASLALLTAFTFFPKGLEFSGRFSTAIAIAASATALTALGIGDIDLDRSATNLAVVEGSHHCIALVLFSDEDEAEALGLATGSGGEDDFVDRCVSSDHLLELVLRGRKGQISDVEFEAFGLFSLLPAAFLLVVIGVSHADAASVDSVTIKRPSWPLQPWIFQHT